MATILSLDRSGRWEDCTLILHKIFENSALRVLAMEFAAKAEKKKKEKEIWLVLEIFLSCTANWYNEWKKKAMWRNGKGNILRHLIGTWMAGLPEV